jgi:endogenous inhibitor of DNA gyrase (YacG/DUF329 family)
VLDCPDCKAEFTHSEITEIESHSTLNPFTGLLAKPEFPGDGLRLECPNCKKNSLYWRHQLVYRPT